MNNTADDDTRGKIPADYIDEAGQLIEEAGQWLAAENSFTGPGAHPEFRLQLAMAKLALARARKHRMTTTEIVDPAGLLPGDVVIALNDADPDCYECGSASGMRVTVRRDTARAGGGEEMATTEIAMACPGPEDCVNGPAPHQFTDEVNGVTLGPEDMPCIPRGMMQMKGKKQ